MIVVLEVRASLQDDFCFFWARLWHWTEELLIANPQTVV